MDDIVDVTCDVDISNDNILKLYDRCFNRDVGFVKFYDDFAILEDEIVADQL
jgi:hypothetical protein